MKVKTVKLSARFMFEAVVDDTFDLDALIADLHRWPDAKIDIAGYSFEGKLRGKVTL